MTQNMNKLLCTNSINVQKKIYQRIAGINNRMYSFNEYYEQCSISVDKCSIQ